MNLTKYPQSCFILEKNGKKLLIDPGSFVAERYQAEELPKVNAILLTHRHPDHIHETLLRAIARNIPVVANQDVADMLGNLVTQVVNDGQENEVAGFTIKAFERSHVLLPDSSEGPQNTAFLIDDYFFHGGDTADVEGIAATVAAIPIAGPDISPRDAFRMAQTLGAEVVIPMHYDYFIADPNFFANLAKNLRMSFEIKPLQDGESLAI